MSGWASLAAWELLTIALLAAGQLYLAARWWLKDPGRARASRQFRRVVRQLEPGPHMTYRNQDAGVLFTVAHSWIRLGPVPIGQIRILMRVQEAEGDVIVAADLFEGERAAVVWDEYEVRTGQRGIAKMLGGGRLFSGDDGLDIEDLGPQGWRWSIGRAKTILSGMLWASEAELTEVCAQLRDARLLRQDDHYDDDDDGGA